jgi:hypothetical protein
MVDKPRFWEEPFNALIGQRRHAGYGSLPCPHSQLCERYDAAKPFKLTRDMIGARLGAATIRSFS